MKNDKYLNKYRIPSARAPWHDYNGGEYFITICTNHREHYFGEIRGDEMLLSDIGKYAVENLEQISGHYPYCLIPLFVVMPNHIHAIVIINETPTVETMCTSSDNIDQIFIETMYTSSLQGAPKMDERWKNEMVDEKMQSISARRGKLSTAIGGYKRSITRYAHQNRIDFGWQTRFHDHIVRDQEEMNRIADYISNNVARWKEDKFYSPAKRRPYR